MRAFARAMAESRNSRSHLALSVRMAAAYAGEKVVRIEVYNEMTDELLCSAQDNGSGSFVGGGRIGEATALLICPVFEGTQTDDTSDELRPHAVSVQW